MSGDPFTRQKFLWLEQIAMDGSLPPSAARLAIVLAKYLNRGSGDAWPSIVRLAADLGIVENCARKSLKAMAAAGHLAVETGGGRNATNRYRPTIKTLQACEGFRSEKPRTGVKGNEDEKPCTAVKGLRQETLHGRSLNPARAFTKPCTPVHPNPYKNPLKETSDSLRCAEEMETPSTRDEKKPAGRSVKSRPSPARKQSPDGFDSFWRAYPRKVAKDAARRAYSKALESATPAELLAGAERLAEERAREPDPTKREKFTPHPATWLNGERWKDAPAPPPSPVFDAPRLNQREGHGFRVMRVGDFR